MPYGCLLTVLVVTVHTGLALAPVRRPRAPAAVSLRLGPVVDAAVICS